MSKSIRTRPSPAMVVAVVALSFALVGSAIAGTESLKQAITKAKVKSIAKKQANKVLTQREASLNVNSASRLGGQPAASFATKAGNEGLRLVGTPGQPAFQNGWTNFGSGFAPAGFYKDQFGVVHLQGVIAPGTDDAAAFTLPAGYRPSTNHYQSIASGPTNNDVAATTIEFTGQVFIFGATNFVSLESIEFVAGS